MSVASLTVHMWRTAADQGRHRRPLVESALKTGASAFAGVFLFTLLMITREGMETALLMGTLLFQQTPIDIIVGAAAARCWRPLRRLAVVAVRPPREPRAVLPGDRGVPARSSSCSS